MPRNQYVKPEPDAECRRLLIYLSTSIAQRYGGRLPVRLEVERHQVMRGFLATACIPGQDRAVYVKEDCWLHGDDGERDQIVDDVHFAIYKLLEEEEDDD